MMCGGEENKLSLRKPGKITFIFGFENEVNLIQNLPAVSPKPSVVITNRSSSWNVFRKVTGLLLFRTKWSRMHKELTRHIPLGPGVKSSHGNPQLPAKVYPVLLNFYFKWTIVSDPVTIQVAPKRSVQVEVRTACSRGWLLSRGSSSQSPSGSQLVVQVDKRLIISISAIFPNTMSSWAASKFLSRILCSSTSSGAHLWFKYIHFQDLG